MNYDLDHLKDVLDKAMNSVFDGKTSRVSKEELKAQIWKPTTEKVTKRVLPRLGFKSPFDVQYKHFLKVVPTAKTVDGVLPCNNLNAGDVCRPCEFVKNLFKQRNKKEEFKTLISALRAKMNVTALICSPDNPLETLKFWQFSDGTYKKFLSKFTDPDYANFTNTDGEGWDWKVYHKISENGKKTLECETFKQYSLNVEPELLKKEIDRMWNYFDENFTFVMNSDDVTKKFEEWVSGLGVEEVPEEELEEAETAEPPAEDEIPF